MRLSPTHKKKSLSFEKKRMNKNDQAVIEAQSLEKRIQNVHEYITLIKPQKGELENQENKNKKPAKITQRQR